MTEKKKSRRGDDSAGAGRRRESFPGGASTGEVPLRVTADRIPIAEIFAHGATTPDVEVCGVLVGYVAEDSAGAWVHVTAAIRGENAREKGAHVTFTQETWNHIHDELEKKHAGSAIVGWYHTHPGFGVFLSEMDRFIHTNFFGAAEQIAVVYDPLSGRMGIFAQRGVELVAVPRYWREGRDVDLQVREPVSEDYGKHASADEVRLLRESIASLETTVRDGLRRQWLTTLGAGAFLLICLALLVWPLVDGIRLTVGLAQQRLMLVLPGDDLGPLGGVGSPRTRGGGPPLLSVIPPEAAKRPGETAKDGVTLSPTPRSGTIAPASPSPTVSSPERKP